MGSLLHHAESPTAELGLFGCGTRAWLPRSLWNLPGPDIEPMSQVPAGSFLTAGPPGKSSNNVIHRPVIVVTEKELWTCGWISACYLQPPARQPRLYQDEGRAGNGWVFSQGLCWAELVLSLPGDSIAGSLSGGSFSFPLWEAPASLLSDSGDLNVGCNLQLG